MKWTYEFVAFKILMYKILLSICTFNFLRLIHVLKKLTLREKCPYLEIFSSVFSSIRTEYRAIRSNSPYSDRMRENMDQKNSETDTFHAVWNLCSWKYLLENYQVRQFVKIMISSTLLTYVHNLLRSELSSKNSELLYACSLFCFCQLIGNIVISGNCRVQFTNPIFCHLIDKTPVQVPYTNFPVDTRYL